MLCHICAEEKPEEKFTTIPYFNKYKKNRPVQWCHECQKMYIQMKKENRRLEKFLQDTTKFVVSFH